MVAALLLEDLREAVAHCVELGAAVFDHPVAALEAERDGSVDELEQVAGNVLVTGHTDNQPIARSARFPSNWHLSDERARNVRDLLVAHKVAADRIRAEGRADAEPVVPNDTASNRALNRRVEVTLYVGRPYEASASRPQGK